MKARDNNGLELAVSRISLTARSSTRCSTDIAWNQS